MKIQRTTAIAIFAAAVIILGIILVAFEKATLKEVGIFSGLITPFILMVLGFYSKDSRDTFRTVNPDKPRPKDEDDEES